MPGERILVIDDSKYMASFLADTALPALGYEALVASTGQRGLELVSTQKPDLILLDLNLPDMSGIDVMHHLAAEGSQTAVILITAHGSERVAVEAFRLGVRDYLTKPIDLEGIADALQRALHEPRLQRDKRQLAEELHRTNVELKRQVDQVATFTSIGRTITASLDLERILTRVLEGAVQLCHAEEATVWLLEGTHQDLIMVAELGMDQSTLPMPRMTRLKVDDALAGEAVRTRQPIIQVAEQGSGIKVKTGYMVKAVMYVPLLIQDRCLGVASVANRVSARPFAQSDLQSLQTLTDYAAIAIENARLYEKTQNSLKERLAELAAIGEVSEAVATLDLSGLLSSAMNRIHEVFNVAAATLFLADESQSYLHSALCSTAEGSATPSLRVPFGRGLVGNCAKNGTSYFTNDPASHPLFLPEVDQAMGLETHSLLVVPLATKERVIGAIELANKRSGPFDEQDARLLKAIATPVAVAVDSVHLFDQIARERATLHAVLEGSANPILIVNQSGRLLLCNPAAQRLFAIPTDDTVDRRLEEATGLPRLGELIAQDQIVTEEIELQERTYLASVAPIAGVGSVIEMQDITYLKELDTAKSEFVTTVSHDLRAPLASITGFIDLLPEAGSVNEQQQQFIAQAIKATKKMRQLIDDLLDLAKIEAGLGRADTACDLCEIAQEVVADSQGMAMSSEIRLSLQKRGEIPLVMGNVDQFRRALSNLVGNALKYTPPGGRVRVGLQATDQTLYIAVADTGRGISEEDLPHVFDKFYRAKGQKKEGSGLGLAMVKSIVEAHGGSVSLRSQTGKGSTFTVALPLT